MHKLVNGIKVDLTAEEIAQRQQDEIAFAEAQANIVPTLAYLSQRKLAFVTDSSASATFEIYYVSMDANSTANGLLAPLVLEAGDILKMQTANADKIEGMISYLEIFDEKST
jgi:hypothetical protein